MNSNSSSAAALNRMRDPSAGLASTGAPGFFTTTRFRGCAWFFWISCKLCSSAFNSLMRFSSASRLDRKEPNSSGVVPGFAAEFFFQAVQKIKLQTSVRGQHLITGFRRIFVCVPRRNFGGDAHDCAARRPRQQVNGELIKGALVLIERLVSGGHEAVHNRELLAGIRLQVLQRALDFFRGLRKRASVRHSLRKNSGCQQHDEKATKPSHSNRGNEEFLSRSFHGRASN